MNSRPGLHGPVIVLIAAVWCLAAAAASAAPPTVQSISLRGLQIEGTTTLAIDGSGLSPDARLVLPFAAEQKVRPGGSDSHVEIDVTLPADVEPGIYHLRLASGQGISQPLAIGVDRLVQRPLVERVEQLPVALHGELTGPRIIESTFTGSKGSRVIVDVESQRLGANLKPTVRLLDPRGVQLAWSSQNFFIGGDARCEATLPADGTYTIQLHDLLYRGAAPGFFRLKVGDLHYADLVYPLGLAAGETSSLAVVSSNLPADARVELQLPSDTPSSRQPVHLPEAAALTGARPQVMVSRHAELREEEVQASPLPSAPVAVSGRLSAEGEEDSYTLPVAPGDRLRLDVLARRLGSPLDALLIVRTPEGKELARSDDRPNTSDPGLNYTVPADTRQLQLVVRDLLERGGNQYVYRLEAIDLKRGDFTVELPDTMAINVPAGGTQVVRVQVKRAGYRGPIHLSVPELPSGYQLAGETLPAGDTLGLLTITAPADAADAKLVSVLAQGGSQQQPILQLARTPDETPSTVYQPRLRGELGLAVVSNPPLRIRWSGSESDELPLVQGTSRNLDVEIQRGEGVTGKVRLQLLTSQVMPRKKVKKDDKEEEVDDLDRALRLADTPLLQADSHDASAKLLVPVDLPKRDWALVLQAELLGADDKSVVATAATPVRYLTAQPPFTIALKGSASVQAVAGAGQTGTLQGTIQRRDDFSQAVTVMLQGLPEGYQPPQVVVPVEQAEFTLPVQFAFEAKPGELKDVRLVATWQPDAEKADQLVRSEPVPVEVTVVAGTKPPEESPARPAEPPAEKAPEKPADAAEKTGEP